MLSLCSDYNSPYPSQRETRWGLFYAYFEEEGFQAVTDCGMYHKRDGSKRFLAGIYADEGISGTSLRRRHAFNQMIEDAFAGKFDVIVCKNVQRFARDVENAYPLMKDLAEKGVAVYFWDGNLCTTNPSDDSKILKDLTSAQDESTSKSRNVQFGLHLKMKKGKWVSRAPFGYYKHKAMLERQESELDVVKRIAYLYDVESFGSQRIAQNLEDNGIGSSTADKKWRYTKFFWILSNPIYAGLQVQHLTYMKDVNRNKREAFDRSKWVITYRPELAVFTIDYWNHLQLEMHRRGRRAEYNQIVMVDGKPELKEFVAENRLKKENRKHSSKHIFSNLITCGNCGRTHQRRKRNTKYESYDWVCSTYVSRGRKGCKYHNAIIQNDLLERVKTEIIEHRENKNDRQWSLDAFLKVRYKPVDETELAAMDAKLLSLEERYNVTLDQLAENRAMKDVLQRRLDKLQDEMVKIQEDKRKVLQREQDIQNIRMRFEKFMHFLDTVDVDRLDNRTLKQIVDGITITTNERKLARGEDAKEVVITWKFFDQTEDDIAWEYLNFEAAEWKRNVWYGGMTDEEVEAEEERMAIEEEWLQTPEGQQHLKDQEELRQVIHEQELMEMNAKS